MLEKGYTTMNFFIEEKIFITQGVWGVRKYFLVKTTCCGIEKSKNSARPIFV